MVFEAEFAQFKATDQQLIDVELGTQAFDDLVEIAMFDLQFVDAPLNRFITVVVQKLMVSPQIENRGRILRANTGLCDTDFCNSGRPLSRYVKGPWKLKSGV